MRVLVTGVNGQLGHDVMNVLLQRGHQAVGCGSKEKYSGLEDYSPATLAPYRRIDITRADEVNQVMHEVHPDAVIHCAAWTAVDAAELPENHERVRLLNAVAPQLFAEASAELNAKMMLISTDYVFDGNGDQPWEPDSKAYCPANYYGVTKLLGEQAVSETVLRFFIIRTSWLFGAAGRNFVNTMLKIGRDHRTINVVNDQIGTPTYSPDLARLLADIIETDSYGFYHATNEGGYISWYEFAKEIFRQAEALGFDEYSQKRVSVSPVSTEEYGLSLAKRPANSRLDKRKLLRMGFQPLPSWQDALDRYLNDYFQHSRRMLL